MNFNLGGVEIVEAADRQCGRRKTHGTYIVSKMRTSENGILSPFTLMNPPVPYQVPLHRGPRIVDGAAVIQRMPMETWWAGQSKETEIKKNGDQWAIHIFGMPISKRINTGECAGCKDADEALAVLLTKLSLTHSKAATKAMQALVVDKVNEMPRVAEHYEAFIQAIQEYTMTSKVSCLMDAQAAVWRMAYTVRPSIRKTIIPNLVTIITALGLRKDALEMAKLIIK
jgi:hypothetical protein